MDSENIITTFDKAPLIDHALLVANVCVANNSDPLPRFFYLLSLNEKETDSFHKTKGSMILSLAWQYIIAYKSGILRLIPKPSYLNGNPLPKIPGYKN